MSKPSRRRPSLLIERLEDRINPVLIGLEAADVPVSVSAGVDGTGEVAMRSDGSGFVVAYSTADAAGLGVYFKRYDANWQLVQGPVAVNTFTTNDQVRPSVAMDGSGNFVIAYESFGQDPGDSAGQSGIYARRFTAAGAAVDAAEFRVNTTTVSQQRTPDVGVNAAGQITIVYRTGVSVNTVLSQSYTSTTGALTTVGGELTVKLGDGASNNATVPKIALDGSGNMAVTYQLDGLDGDNFGIHAQRLTPTGTVLSAEFQVNTVTAGAQQFPDIAMDGAGNFNIVWYSPGVDGAGTAIVMQRYNASGVAQGSNITVNTGITTGNQIDPHVSANAGGTFLVTWYGEESDLDAVGADAYYKVFNLSGGVLVGDTLINLGTAANDQTEGNVVSGITTSGDFVVAFDTATGANFDSVLRRYAEDADVGFTVGTSSGAESANASIGITRTGAQYVLANTATTVAVNDAGGGTATSGTDYTAFSGNVTFSATAGLTGGTQAATRSITITDDASDEANETINLNFGTITGGTVAGQTTHQYTITDNDPPPSISVGNVTLNEGNSGTSLLTFTISLSAVSGNVVTGNFATADGTATAGSDYVAVGSTAFTIPANTLSITRTVTINGDTTFENAETFTLNLSGVTNTSNATASGTGQINNDDTAPTISVSSPSVTETDSGSVNLTFILSLSAVSGLPVSGSLGTSGTATSGTDYTAVGPSFTIPAGSLGTTVVVAVTGDALFEGNETLILNLSSVTGTSNTTATGTGTIADNDAAATITISSGNNQSTIAGTAFASPLVALVRNANNNAVEGVTVTFTAPGAGASFTPTPVVVTTSASGLASTGTITANATVGSNYSVSAAATGGTNPTVNFTLSNLPAISLSINDVTASEGNSGTTTFTFTVSLSAAAGAGGVTFDVATADGTATTTDADYVARSLTAQTIPAGQSTYTFDVTVNGDTKFEVNEAFVVNVTNVVGASVADGQGQGTITNDDTAPSITIADVTLNEGNAGTTNFAFTVTLSAPSGVAATVAYATADGTALAGSDYTATSGTLTFAPGETTKTVTVLVTGETVFEVNQTFFVNLSAPTNATIADNQGLGTITNDDAAPTLAVNSPSASEAGGPLTFTVTRTGATELPISVNYATADGTAVSTAGGPGTPDFTSTSGSLNFAASLAATLTQTFTVALTNDAVYEASEQFAANLSGATNTSNATATGTGTITNDDAAPSLSINDFSVSENGTATFTVTLTGSTALPIGVSYATADGTAVATGSATPGTPDYTTTTGTLNFAASASASQTLTVTVPLTNDTTNEATEQFVLNLSGATNGATISDTQGVATITDDDGVPSLAITDVAVNEGNVGTTNFTFTVSLSAPSGQPVTVAFATADGTGLAGTDYTAASGTLTFAPGETTKTVTVLVTGETVFEVDQTFFVNLTSPTNATIADNQGLGTITNDDAAPTLTINDVTASEAAGVLTFTVTRTGATELPASATYTTADGTAVSTAGGPGTPDFTAATGTVTVAASLAATATQSFSITLTNDAVYEAVEQFVVNLTTPGNATIADPQGLGTILNDDAAPSLSINDFTVDEDGTATFTVTLTGATALPIAVDYVTADGTAVATGSATPGTPDYTATTGTLNFPASASGTQTLTITVPLTDDTTAEDTETFVLNLSNASNGATIADAQGVATVTNDDPVPSLSVDDVTLSEGNVGTTNFTFTVSLSAASGQTVTVNYATADGTAAGTDYTAASGTLTFAPGETTKTVTVLVTGDTVFEPDQTFFLNLSAPTNATIADGQGDGTILNDDAAPTLTIDDVTVSEAVGTLTFTVTRTGATELDATVDYATADASAVSTGTAPGQPDFTAATGTVTIAASLAPTATQTFTVTIADDNVYEAVKQFFADLSNPSNATIADPQGLATIQNDDAPPSISVNDFSVSENGTATFTVTLTGSTALPIGVSYATADGTAVATGSATPGTPDYTTTTGTLNFPASASGTQTLTVTVPLTDDTTAEDTEQFVLNLSNASNGATISDSQGVATVTDDDPVPTVSIDDVTAAEGDAGTTAFTFSVTLSAASAQTVTVAYQTTDGTATGTDYTAASGTLTFASGETTKTVTVLVTGDTVFEPGQTFTLNLSAPTNATIADAQGDGTITNDDAAPTLTIDDVTVSEAVGTLTFTVTRTGATELDATVDYATADASAVSTGTAPGQPDFTAATGTVTIAASLAPTATQTFTVTIADDNVYEAVKQFFADLSNPSNATIADPQGLATILNDDAPPSISINDFTVAEDGTATFTITLTGATALPIAVDYATADGTALSTATATPGTPDYTTTGGTLTFSPSASGTQTLTITVPLTNDTTNETDEQFVLNLSNSSNGATISDPQGVATVTNDDPVPSLSVDDVTAAEGDSGTTAFTFTVTLSAPSAQTVTVAFATADGTATGTDYTAASGTLTFAPGVLTQTVTVLVTGDTVFEPDQTFTLNLTAPTNATIGDAQGLGTITNDDAAPTLAIDSVTASEGAGTLTFTVTRTGATEVPVTVNYATADGTAAAGSDYTATGGTLNFAASLTPTVMQTFTVTLTGDTADELTESFTATLSGAAGGTIATATGTGTVTDDDLPVATADTATVLEDGTVTAPTVLGNDNAAPGSVAELVGATTPNGVLVLNPDGTFTYAPATDFNGTDSFQYRVRNTANEVSAPVTVTITVTPVNDVPSFTKGPDQTVGRNNGAETVPGWATGISTGPANEAAQAPTFLVTVTGTTETLAFDAAPAIDPATGALTFTPRATTFGTATVSVRLTDDGGTANGGVDTSAAQTFTITVTKKSTADDTPVDQIDFPQYAAGAGAGGPGTVDVFNPNGAKASSSSPFGLGVGVRAVLADVTGDGTADVIAASGPGVAGRLTVTDPTTGKTILSDFPFGAGFTGGLFVAAGDVNADGMADVIVTPDASGGGRVVIYDGATGQVIASFLGIDDKEFRGGARVAVGDVNGDGVTDVIVSAGLTGGPRVAVFDGTTLGLGGAPKKLINDFFAFDESLRDGVYVAAGDLNGDGFADLVFGGGPGGGARVLARDGKALFGPGAGAGQFVTLTNFFAGDDSLRDGVQVAVKTADADGRADLVTAVQTPKGPQVRLYLGKTLGPTGGPFTTDLDPYPGLLTGVYVG